MQVETLEPPLFLIAMPQIVDPFFHRSVVLLLEHNAEGAFGLIVNRPLDLKIASVVTDLGIAWRGGDDALVYLGGPVQPNAGMTLFSGAHGEEDKVRTREVAPGIHLANDTETLKRLAAAAPEKFRLIVGYAGWSAGQLEGELSRNDWLLAPVESELVFAREADRVWPRALESIGVRPESLPAVTGAGDESSN
jgi:putative transcriptional regulator